MYQITHRNAYMHFSKLSQNEYLNFIATFFLITNVFYEYVKKHFFYFLINYPSMKSYVFILSYCCIVWIHFLQPYFKPHPYWWKFTLCIILVTNLFVRQKKVCSVSWTCSPHKACPTQLVYSMNIRQSCYFASRVGAYLFIMIICARRFPLLRS